MKLHAWLFALAFVPTAATTALAPQGMQMSAEEEARALIGIEYSGQSHGGERLVPHLSCTDGGGGRLQIGGVDYKEWHGLVECRGRQVLTLKRRIPGKEREIRWRIVDTLLLPPVRPLTEPYAPHGVNDLWIFSPEECALDGRYDTDFVALVRWTDREQIDWRTGVEHAWTFDLKHERIVPVSTKRIVCEQPMTD